MESGGGKNPGQPLALGLSGWWKVGPLPELGAMGEGHVWGKQSRLLSDLQMGRCLVSSQVEMCSVQPEAGSWGRKLGPLTQGERMEREWIWNGAPGPFGIVERGDGEDVATKRLMVERKEAIWPENRAPDPHVRLFLAVANPEGRHQLLVNAEST